MNENVITGFNPEVVEGSINEISEECERINDTLNKASTNFYHELKESWFSPKAVEFEKYLYNIDRCIYNLKISYYNVMASMADAYNAHAIANNLPTLSSKYEHFEYQPDNALFGELTLLERSPEGNVVMNIPRVEAARDAFATVVEDQMQEVFVSQQTPAFFDQNGQQIESYYHLINSMQQKLKGSFNELIHTLNTKIEEERSAVEKAASQATQNLSK